MNKPTKTAGKGVSTLIFFSIVRPAGRRHLEVEVLCLGVWEVLGVSLAAYPIIHVC